MERSRQGRDRLLGHNDPTVEQKGVGGYGCVCVTILSNCWRRRYSRALYRFCHVNDHLPAAPGGLGLNLVKHRQPPENAS